MQTKSQAYLMNFTSTLDIKMVKTSDFEFNLNLENYSNCHSFYLTSVTKDEISKIIISLKTSNSYWYDKLSSRLIKVCSDELNTPLAYSINMSFIKGEFTRELKQSIIQ